MKSHKHARLTAKGRALLVSRVLDEGWSVAIASEAAGVSKPTGFKWLARFRAEGAAGLADRSSRPFSSPGALTAQQQGELERLRRQRWPLWRIAMQAGRGVATRQPMHAPPGLVQAEVAGAANTRRALRARRGRRAAAHRHQEARSHRRRVGHRITGDRTNNHNRGIGWDMVHLAIDDHSRVSWPPTR